VVGDDAADKVGVGVPQGGHELGEGLLVELPHRAEHALLGLVGGAERRLRHAGHLVQAHDAVHWCGGERRKEENEETGVMGSSLVVQTYRMKDGKWTEFIYSTFLPMAVSAMQGDARTHPYTDTHMRPLGADSWLAVLHKEGHQHFSLGGGMNRQTMWLVAPATRCTPRAAVAPE